MTESLLKKWGRASGRTVWLTQSSLAYILLRPALGSAHPELPGGTHGSPVWVPRCLAHSECSLNGSELGDSYLRETRPPEKAVIWELPIGLMWSCPQPCHSGLSHSSFALRHLFHKYSLSTDWAKHWFGHLGFISDQRAKSCPGRLCAT